ncbi:myrosinase 1 [Diabrotica virgifera virgifera]|uniref:Myrosinase 1-like n=1 Tax=Diabrotica virgifera virgifera TaxID=50390 RepID=A0ABM5IQR8_DIAVI|nr:myrosinase 1 [Diabrotica virgifera virgifera]
MTANHFFYFLFLVTYAQAKNNGSFPKDFLFGVATSAYQIEGAWDEDGKGENIWDHMVHQVPSPIKNNDTGDIACDSYHKYKEDVDILEDLGVNFYRFSISWSRILPTGYPSTVNKAGLEYYKNLTKELVSRNITPVATIFHWDLPQPLSEIDGWSNPRLADLFVEYSRIVIQGLPDVGVWITFNEPKQICHYGYGVGTVAPAIHSSGLREYWCAYTVLNAHAKTYHMYKSLNLKAPMGITIDCEWYEPLTDSVQDKQAAKRNLNFECGLYAHPLFIGDWPEDVKMRIYERSMAENYNTSRLPELTLAQISYIYGTTDFFGLNYYVTFTVADGKEGPTNVTSYDNDVRIVLGNVSNADIDVTGFPIVPLGLTKVLNHIKTEYNVPKILITEIGISDNGTLEDESRIKTLKNYFSAILDAVYDHDVNVIGVTIWSLMDNLEWLKGYSAHFGLYSVDFTDDNRTRTAKASAEYYKNVIKTKSIEDNSHSDGGQSITKVNGYVVGFIIVSFYFFKLW